MAEEEEEEREEDDEEETKEEQEEMGKGAGMTVLEAEEDRMNGVEEEDTSMDTVRGAKILIFYSKV